MNEMKSQPVHTYNICIIDGDRGWGIRARSGSLAKAVMSACVLSRRCSSEVNGLNFTITSRLVPATTVSLCDTHQYLDSVLTSSYL